MSCRIAALDKRCSQLVKEKELIEKKMQRVEKAKEAEAMELRAALEASQVSSLQLNLSILHCPALSAPSFVLLACAQGSNHERASASRSPVIKRSKHYAHVHQEHRLQYFPLLFPPCFSG